MSFHGTDIFNDASTHTGAWKTFTVLTAIVLYAITDNGDDPSTVPTGVSIPAGTFVAANGVFSSIDLTSGMVAMARA